MIRFWQAVLWEIQQMVTVHRRGLLMMVFIPLLYTLLFGGLFSLQSVKNVPIGVVDLDGSAASREFIRALDDADELAISMEAGSEEELLRDMQDGTIDAAVIIPKNYAAGLAAAQPVSVGAVLNNGNTVTGGTAARGIQAVIGTVSAEQAAKNRLAIGQSPEEAEAEASPVQLSVRSLYHTAGGYVDFFLVILILHAFQIGTVFVLGPMTVLELYRKRKTLAVHPYISAASKALAYAILETVVMMACLYGSALFFGMVIRAPFWLLAGFVLLFALAMTSFATLAGSWVRTPGQAISYTLFYIMPSVLFSGAIWPRESMDGFSWFLTWIMPIGYTADAARDLLVRGDTPHLAFYSGCLVTYICVCLIGAVIGIRRKGGKSVA